MVWIIYLGYNIVFITVIPIITNTSILNIKLNGALSQFYIFKVQLSFFALCKQPQAKEEKKAFSNEFFIPKRQGGAVASTVISWLLSYWFNCLFSSQPCLFIDLWQAFDCAHCMHADPTRYKPQIALSLNTSLISLCLMSGTTQRWQVGKIPPSPISLISSLLCHLLTCQRLWGECLDLCKKKPSLLANDCQLNHALWLDPWGHILHAETLNLFKNRVYRERHTSWRRCYLHS